MNVKLRAWLLAAMCGTLPAAAHDHYAAGIVDANSNNQPDAGERLQFVGANPTAKIFHLCPRPFGFRPTQRCGGYYMLDELPRTLHPSDSFSFTALPSGEFEPAVAGHARTGAWIWMEIVSVTGPLGGEFGFWDEGQSANFDEPTVSFPVNQPTGNYAFVLSEGFDSPDEDPAGHIHGRAWTATVAGNYFVGVRLVDRSTSGPGGGPWHQPSQVYTLQFQAGPDFRPTYSFTAGGNFRFTWPSLMGIYNATSQLGVEFQIERASSLSPSNWQVIGSVRGTTAATATFTEPSVPTGPRFYRFKYLWNPGGSSGLAAAESLGALASSHTASENVAVAMTAAALTSTPKTAKSQSAANAAALRKAALVWQASHAVRLAQLQSYFAKAKAAQPRANTVRPQRAKPSLNFKSLKSPQSKPKPKTRK